MTTQCPQCKIRNNAHACVSEQGENIQPVPGSVSVCSRCGCICLYQDDLTLKEAPEEVLKEIKTNYPDDYKILITASLYVIEKVLKNKKQ